MFEIIKMSLVVGAVFFLISRACKFFANRNVDPFSDIPEDATEEVRA